MTLRDLQMQFACTSNVDPNSEFNLSRALLALFLPWQAMRGSPIMPDTRATGRMGRLNLLAPLREVVAIAGGREGATS